MNRFLLLLITLFLSLSSKALVIRDSSETICAQTIKTNSKTESFSRNEIVILVNQPIGWAGKFRVKLGYKLTGRNIILLSYTHHYYHSLFPLWEEYYSTGDQVFTEFQHIFEKEGKFESFFYLKGGLGSFKSRTDPFNVVFDQRTFYDGSGSYALIGAGVGQNFNWRGLFIQLNQGLKYCHLTSVNGYFKENSFRFPSSPGSLVDLNFHLGFRF